MSDQPALLRQWIILRSLGARRQGSTLRDLAAQTNVSTKTILRDLALLRRIGFPLVDEAGDQGRKSWKLNGHSGLLQLSFTIEEAAALYLGRQFLEPLAGTYFFSGAQSAFKKIRATLGDAPLRHLEKLAAAFYHKSHGWGDYSRQGELIDELVRAIEDRRLTVVTYQSLRAKEPAGHYGLHPYSLVWHKHALYLIAWSCDHKAIRTFKVDRLSAADPQDDRFDPPKNFDPASYLSGSFGIFAPRGPTQRIRVRFTPTAARVIVERTFHPSQKLTRERDGSLLAQWDLSSIEEFLSWILSWGKEAEVLEPISVRKTIAAKVFECLEQYRPNRRRRRHKQLEDQRRNTEQTGHNRKKILEN